MWGARQVLCPCDIYTAPTVAPPEHLKLFLCGGPCWGPVMRDKFCSDLFGNSGQRHRSHVLVIAFSSGGQQAITVCFLSGSRTCQPGCNVFAVFKKSWMCGYWFIGLYSTWAGCTHPAWRIPWACASVAFPSCRSWRQAVSVLYTHMWIMALFPCMRTNPHFSLKIRQNMSCVWCSHFWFSF